MTTATPARFVPLVFADGEAVLDQHRGRVARFEPVKGLDIALTAARQWNEGSDDPERYSWEKVKA